jgi:hypothetical protein
MDSSTAASQDPISISLFIASSGMVEPPQSVIALGACTRHRKDGFDNRLGMLGNRDVFDEWVDGAQAPIAIGIPADRIGLDEDYSRGRRFGKGEPSGGNCRIAVVVSAEGRCEDDETTRSPGRLRIRLYDFAPAGGS